jgi:hypothetical protein
MLRRFEAYGLAPGTDPEVREELTRVLRDTGRFIPEVLDSAVGRNRSDTAIDVVWEHAYERPDAYAHYMRHPFHICVLDRFLLPEHPECITASRRDLQLGLFGYEVAGAPFRASAGIRRVLVLRVARDAASQEVGEFIAALGACVDPTGGVLVSVAAPNSMGLEWFPDGWTHVWERVFVDESTMRAALDDEAARLATGPVTESLDLWYEIDAAAPSVPAADATPADDEVPVRMIDEVVVAATDLPGYLDAFHTLYVPGAQRRGLVLDAVWHTPPTIADDVTVTTVFAVGTWADWERARNAAVADPDVARWIAARRALMRAGSRRFVVAPTTVGADGPQ